MPHEPNDPRWPKMLSLTVHELRTPLTVVSGYVRMLLKDAAGPLGDQQRTMLAETEKSCARLSSLLAEISDLGSLEGNTATFNRGPVSLRAVLAQAVAHLPPVTGRRFEVELEPAADITLHGDPIRLRTAFGSVLQALRRELISSPRLLVRETVRHPENGSLSWIAMADASQIDALSAAEDDSLTTFDEWRGGCGLSLAVARRILERHGGRIWSPAVGPKSGAVIAISHA